MPQTPNHGYNVPNKGDANWHKPLNDNFQQYDTDIEIRDTDGNKGNYSAKSGAKFFATDTEKVYLGGGSKWDHVPSTGQTPTLTGINTGGAPLGVGTGSPDRPLDVRGGGNADLSTTDGDVRVGDPQHRLAIGVSRSGSDAGTVNVRAKGGADRLRLGAGSNDGVVDVQPRSASVLNRLTLTPLSSGGGQTLTFANGSDPDGECYFDPSQPAISLRIANSASSGMSIEQTGVSIRGDSGVRGNFRVDTDLDVGGAVINGLQIDGNLGVTGTISAGSKNFVHPVDTADGEKEVVYTSSEAPTPRTEVSGVAELSDGRAEIALPDHFDWVTDDEEPLHVQTTPYSTEAAGLAVVVRSPDRIVVEDRDGTGEYEFSYTVRGTRDGYADPQVVREPEGSVGRTDADRAAGEGGGGTQQATSPADD